MVDDKIPVSFTCQRCSQNLKLDDAFFDSVSISISKSPIQFQFQCFSEHVSAELNLPVHSNNDVDLESQATSFDNYVPPRRLSDSRNGTSGFMLITDENEVDLLSETFRVRAALFDYLSGTSDIDHPLCEECADYLIEMFEQQLETNKKDCDDYLAYYQKIQSTKDEPKLADLEKELNDLSEEEIRLLSELEELKNEEDITMKNIREQEVISKKINDEENRYRKEYVKHQKEWLVAEDEARSLKSQLAIAENQLEKLRCTNVFNATFHIWHEGHFGTINNFHLGTLPSAPVGWAEINTAWGQTTLLFCALARKINLNFEKYRPVPYGSHSYIEIIGENKKIPLYGSGGPKYLWDTKFDVGMMAFLDCMQLFTEKVEELEKKQFKFPYKIFNGKIIDAVNVKYTLRATIISEEQWTKALKYMLTDLKWGLAWVTAQFDSNNGEEIVPH